MKQKRKGKKNHSYIIQRVRSLKSRIVGKQRNKKNQINVVVSDHVNFILLTTIIILLYRSRLCVFFHNSSLNWFDSENKSQDREGGPKIQM